MGQACCRLSVQVDSDGAACGVRWDSGRRGRYLCGGIASLKGGGVGLVWELIPAVVVALAPKLTSAGAAVALDAARVRIERETAAGGGKGCTGGIIPQSVAPNYTQGLPGSGCSFSASAAPREAEGGIGVSSGGVEVREVINPIQTKDAGTARVRGSIPVPAKQNCTPKTGAANDGIARQQSAEGCKVPSFSASSAAQSLQQSPEALASSLEPTAWAAPIPSHGGELASATTPAASEAVHSAPNGTRIGRKTVGMHLDGARVSRLDAGGPAALSGAIVPGDEIVAIDGQQVCMCVCLCALMCTFIGQSEKRILTCGHVCACIRMRLFTFAMFFGPTFELRLNFVDERN